jgi:hypothetical protein
MKYALIIGIGYDEKDQFGPIIVDLYRFYTYCQKIKIEKICVMTDIKDNDNMSRIFPALIDGTVKSDIFEFTTKLNKNKEYHYIHKDDSAERLMKNIVELMPMDISNMILYFSGHGNNQGIILPSRNILPYNFFRDTLLLHLPNSSENIWIIDCCGASGVNLPFVLNYDEKDIYARYQMKQPYYEKIVGPKIICISSAEGRAIVNYNGSIFTNFLIHYLTLGIGSLPYIKRKITKKIEKSKIVKDNIHILQNICIHSSRPIFFELWNWVLKKDIKFEIDKKLGMILWKKDI